MGCSVDIEPWTVKQAIFIKCYSNWFLKMEIDFVAPSIYFICLGCLRLSQELLRLPEDHRFNKD